MSKNIRRPFRAHCGDSLSSLAAAHELERLLHEGRLLGLEGGDAGGGGRGARVAAEHVGRGRQRRHARCWAGGRRVRRAVQSLRGGSVALVWF